MISVIIALGFCAVIGAIFGLLTGVFLGNGFGWIVAAVMTGFSIDVVFNSAEKKIK